jgi:hypothetical protein
LLVACALAAIIPAQRAARIAPSRPHGPPGCASRRCACQIDVRHVDWLDYFADGSW